MAVRRISVNEITTVDFSTDKAVTCCPSPLPGTIVGVGDKCNVKFDGTPSLDPELSQLSYTIVFNPEFIFELSDGSTAMGRCLIKQEDTININGGEVSPCAAGTPTIEGDLSCGPMSYTDNCISSTITRTFTVTNLCVPTVICVEDTPCVD